MNPTTPGFWIFHGSRAVQNNQLRPIHAPVEIVYVWNRRGRELAVKLIGRQQCIPLGNFIGDWQKLDLEVQA
jgi:hypothetical protein